MNILKIHKHIRKGERAERAERELSMVGSQRWEKIYNGSRNTGQVYRFREVMLNRERKKEVMEMYINIKKHLV